MSPQGRVDVPQSLQRIVVPVEWYPLIGKEGGKEVLVREPEALDFWVCVEI